MIQRVTTTDGQLQVYRQRDLASAIAHVPKGVGLRLSDSTVFEEREWMEATLEDGTVGYVLGPAARSHTTLGGSLTTAEEVLKEIETEEPKPPRSNRISPREETLMGVLICAIGIAIMVAANSGLGPSGVRHTECTLRRALRARFTFSRMSEADAVQMKGFGCSL